MVWGLSLLRVNNKLNGEILMHVQNFKMILYCFSNIFHKRNIYFNPKQELRSIFLIEIFFLDFGVRLQDESR